MNGNYFILAPNSYPVTSSLFRFYNSSNREGLKTTQQDGKHRGDAEGDQ